MPYQHVDARTYAGYPCPKCGERTLVCDGNLIWSEGSSPHRVGTYQDPEEVRDIEDIEYIYHCTTCQTQYWSAEASGSMFHEEDVSDMYYTHAGAVWHRHEIRADGTYIFTQYKGSLEWVQVSVIPSEKPARLSVREFDVFRLKGQVQLYIVVLADASGILACKYDIYRGAYGDGLSLGNPDVEVVFKATPSMLNWHQRGWEYCRIEVEQDAAPTGALAPTRFWAVRVYHKASTKIILFILAPSAGTTPSPTRAWPPPARRKDVLLTSRQRKPFAVHDAPYRALLLLPLPHVPDGLFRVQPRGVVACF